MSTSRYCGLTIGFLLLSQLPLLASALSSATKTAVLVGGVLATANALAAYASIRWSVGRPVRALLWVVFGGMTLRLALMLAAVAVAILLARLAVVPLVLALMAYGVLFLVLELIALPRLFRVVTP